MLKSDSHKNQTDHKAIFPAHLQPSYIYVGKQQEKGEISYTKMSPTEFSALIGNSFSYVENILCPKALQIPPKEIALKDKGLADFIFQQWATINDYFYLLKIDDKNWGLFAKKDIPPNFIIGIYASSYIAGEIPKTLHYGMALPKKGLLSNYSASCEFTDSFAEESGGVADSEKKGGLTRFINHAYDKEDKEILENRFFFKEPPLYGNIRPVSTEIFNKKTKESLPIVYFTTGKNAILKHTQLVYPYFPCTVENVSQAEIDFFGGPISFFSNKTSMPLIPAKDYIPLMVTIPAEKEGLSQDCEIPFTTLLSAIQEGFLKIGIQSTDKAQINYHIITKEILLKIVTSQTTDFLSLLTSYLYKQGTDFYSKKDYSNAATSFNSTLVLLHILFERNEQRKELLAEVRWNLGNTYIKQSNHNLGIQTLTLAIMTQFNINLEILELKLSSSEQEQKLNLISAEIEKYKDGIINTYKTLNSLCSNPSFHSKKLTIQNYLNEKTQIFCQELTKLDKNELGYLSKLLTLTTQFMTVNNSPVSSTNKDVNEPKEPQSQLNM